MTSLRPDGWWRPEPFGAWVRLQDGTLVAVDHGLRGRLGLDPEREAPALALPLEAHVAVTRRCDAGCAGCYQDASPAGPEPERAAVSATLQKLAAHRVATVAFGGGEPVLRADLASLADEARALGMTPVTTTNGSRVDHDAARRLGSFSQINVSHDGVRGGYERVRGHDGAARAERAIGLLAGAGIRAGVNVVVTRANLDCVIATAERARELGAVELQLIRYKPGGRGRRTYRELALGPEQLQAWGMVLQRLCEMQELSIRVDCALLPLLVSSAAPSGELLERLGVFGCEAGRYLLGVDAEGAWRPCSCWATSSRGASEWGVGPELSTIREWHRRLPEPCASCDAAGACRGGCQVISLHLRGRMGPDPECPRVAGTLKADLDPGAG